MVSTKSMTQMSVQMPTTRISASLCWLTQSTTRLLPCGVIAPTKPLMQSLRTSVVFGSRSNHSSCGTRFSSPVPDSQCGGYGGSALPGTWGYGEGGGGALSGGEEFDPRHVAAA